MKKARNSFFYIGGGISLVMTLLILMGYIWTPYSPTQMDASAQMQAPSLQHLLGTDNFGRDIFSRVLQGAGTSFLIAVSVVAIGCLAGILVGSLCGYYGGTADVILTRVCDSITAFPSILLALVIVSVVGSGTYNIILALGILFIPSFARIVRGEFARCRHLNYIQSAKLMGVGDARILFSHILPNTFSVLLPDRPGELMRVSGLLAQDNGNIIKLEHNQFVNINRQNGVELKVTLEAFGQDHKKQILGHLVQAGYQVKEVDTADFYN